MSKPLGNKKTGWIPNPAGVEKALADAQTQVWRISQADEKQLVVTAVSASDKAAICLLDAVLERFPSWRRGAQGIGDCVSWGWELALTVATCIEMKLGAPILLDAEYATEPIYGGSRVEARGGRQGGWSDGSYGAAAAKFVTDWGGLQRLDYSRQTSNSEHNLATYSSRKAKQWGNYGCGGKSDSGKLDALAKECPVKKAYQVTTFDQYVAAIESGYPVSICSSQGLSKRGSDGFARPQGTWYHCMLGAGVRYDKPGALITNSWGNSWGTSAPLPGVESDEIKKCSAWVDAKTVDRMLRGGDSFAVTGVDGLKRREINWQEGWHVSGR